MAKFKLKTTITFEAEKVTNRGTICSERGTLHKKPGDWIVNNELIIKDETFRTLFEPVDTEADAMMDD